MDYKHALECKFWNCLEPCEKYKNSLTFLQFHGNLEHHHAKLCLVYYRLIALKRKVKKIPGSYLWGTMTQSSNWPSITISLTGSEELHPKSRRRRNKFILFQLSRNNDKSVENSTVANLGLQTDGPLWRAEKILKHTNCQLYYWKWNFFSIIFQLNHLYYILDICLNCAF